MRLNIHKIILFFLLLDNLYLPLDLGFDFRMNYIVYLLYIIYAIFINKKIFINKNFVITSFLFGVLSLFIAFFKGTPIVLVIKQLILIYISFVVAYILLNAYKFDLVKIFKDYIQFICVAAVIGIIQFISQSIGFLYGSDFSYLGFDMGYYINDSNSRIQSWFFEPSFLVYAFMPVVFISLVRLFKMTELISLEKALFILVVFFLSRSAIGYFGLLLSLLIILNSKYSIFNKPKIIATALGLVLVSGFLIYRIPDIKFRVDDTIKLFFDNSVTKRDIDSKNLSTYAFYSNYQVTKESLKRNPFLGTGLGTYEYNYDKYLNRVVPDSNYRKYYQINRMDANSMFFRLLAEIGLFATIFIIYIIFKQRISMNYHHRLNENTINAWLISNSIFVLIFIRLLRQGHYTMLGFTLFLLMYFYTNKILNEGDKKNSY